VTPAREILYRSYTPRDLDAIVTLDAECFDPPFRFSKPAMRRFTEAGNAWVTVAEADGDLAGFCIVHHEHWEGMNAGYVVTIDVARHFRRCGVAGRMLAGGEEWISRSGGTGMVLHVYTRNTGAITFYERLGYICVGLQRGFYGGTLDAAMYWKELPSY
jgi:[ribosomal protein S18]-alanine N-acetyltransferase